MTTPIRYERLHELLADKALVGLSQHEGQELDALLREFPGASDGSFEKAAAAIAVASLVGKFDAMPLHLEDRLLQRAPGAKAASTNTGRTLVIPSQAPPASYAPPQVAASPVSHPSPVSYPPVQEPRGNVVPLRRPSRAPLVVGWMLAAAACLALAVGAWKYQRITASTVATVAPGKEREQLVGKAGSTTVAWTATDDPAAKGASGDVVWNATEQKGYMRLHGLAKNDPKVSQYQLWIFDKNRDDKYPVDGGVFDVDPTTGDVLVPIKAKIKVDEATLFAVTVERPGGVVVSKRERIVMTAKLGA